MKSDGGLERTLMSSDVHLLIDVMQSEQPALVKTKRTLPAKWPSQPVPVYVFVLTGFDRVLFPSKFKYELYGHIESRKDAAA